MSQPDIHVGDWGTDIELVILARSSGKPIPIQTATTKTIKFNPPDGGTPFEKTASFSTDGSDGRIKYRLQEGDITVSGVWSIQGHVSNEFGSWHSDIEQLEVAENIDIPEPGG